jgi:hypothetical protein
MTSAVQQVFFFLRGQLSSKVGGNVKNHINRFVLKITFIKIYIYNFPIKTFIKKVKLYFGNRVAY